MRVKPDERRGPRSTLVQARGQFISSTPGGMLNCGSPFAVPHRTCRSSRKTAAREEKLRLQTTHGSLTLDLTPCMEFKQADGSRVTRRAGDRDGLLSDASDFEETV